MTAFACWLLLLGLQQPGEAQPFQILELAPGGRPDSILADDLDGDGITDLLLREGRRAAVYFFGGDERSGAPDLGFEMPSRTVVVDLADIDGDAAAELCLLTSNGIESIAFVGRRLGDVARVGGLSRSDMIVSDVPASDVRWADFMLDLDGSGGLDALLPTARGYHLRLRADVGSPFADGGLLPVIPTGTLSLSVRSDLGQVEQSVALPRVYAGDLDGDGRRDVMTFDGRVLRAYEWSGGESGPKWDLLVERVLYDREPSLAEDYLSSRSIDVKRLAADEPASVIVVRSTDGEIDFFSSGDDELLAERRTLRLDGWVLPPDLLDLDGDGRLDLVAPTTDEVSYLRVAQIFLTRSFEMRFWVFRNREGVGFARTPDDVRTVTVPLKYDSSTGRASVEYQTFYSFDGDFDGDGIKDLLLKTGDASMDIYRGTPEGSFSDRAWSRVAIPDASSFRTVEEYVHDLNGDGRSDVILHYAGDEAVADAYFAFLSRP